MGFISLWVKTLIVSGFILFGIWAYFCDLWTERNPYKIENIMGGVMVSGLYMFKVFLLATMIFSAIYLIFKI